MDASFPSTQTLGFIELQTKQIVSSDHSLSISYRTSAARPSILYYIIPLWIISIVIMAAASSAVYAASKPSCCCLSSSATAISSTQQLLKRQRYNPSRICFQGLKKCCGGGGTRSSRGRSTNNKYYNYNTKKGGGVNIIRGELNPSVVISLSTGVSLFLGRFVFFKFQRENVAKQGLPVQNGVTHFEAGDTRAKEYVSLLKSNDPVGFNIVDLLAWGSLGHIAAYYILATSSNGYNPNFFN
ncbi:photosystem I reaction center subunit V, chloroplastic [Malania oleifera]|uniref:photosystem I reaction center subunit V, chloroplastic n=1 Tax=Malania oleifera TaxID=397392 RepID=UPI0025AE016A|nr:photosystem I reaction center subunit V, chloroplastic [Malania oleifera]